MNFLRYLASKRTDYFYNFLLFVAAFVCLALGVNESTRFLAYFSGFFIFFLVRRQNVWENSITGFLLGAWYGNVAFNWLSRFADFTAFHLAVAFNGLMVAVIFVSAYYLYKTFPKSLFIQVFGLSFGIFAMRCFFHYSPFLAYAKAFLTIVNTTTVYDWLVPYFGSTVTDILVLATGSLAAQLYLQTQKRRVSRSLYVYLLVFTLLLAIPLFRIGFSERLNQMSTVKIALVQGNFNWDWDTRVKETNAIVDYYIRETEKVAGAGAQIVVWPEYAVPIDVLHSNQDIAERLYYLSHKLGVTIVTGAIEQLPYRLNTSGKWVGYDLTLVFDQKKGLLEPYRAVHPISSNVVSGSKPIINDVETASFPVISCFEVAHHRFVSDYANLNHPFDFYVGIANIQLFLGTDGAKRIQHHIRRVAMENGKYFIYVSNTGPSLVINSEGDVIYRIPSLTRKSVVLDIPKIKDESFYSNYQELPLIVLLFGVFVFLFRAKRRHK